MSSKRDVWTEFLNATNQDESRKEANLVILGILSPFTLDPCRNFEDIVPQHTGFATGDSRTAVHQEPGYGYHELHVHDSRLSESEEYEWGWCS